MVATAAPPRATLEDLLRTPGRAELINGGIVRFMAVGHLPNLVAGRIFRKIAEYAETTCVGQAYTDSMGFAVPELPSGRESFSPGASYYSGPLPINPMRFVEGPPEFAVEVRSENDYGPAAEFEMDAKRRDYFLAGTLVVWDVDPIAKVIAVYHADNPLEPTCFAIGQDVNAEPAMPGWTLPVAWVMGG